MKNNKKIVLFAMTILVYISSTAQIKKFSCNRFPDSTTLLRALANKPVGVYTSDFCERCNVTDTIKKRLLYLLIPGWTENEIQEYIKRRLTNPFYKVAIYDDAKKISMGNDSLYKKAVDKLINYYGKSERKLIMDRHFNEVDGSILTTVAFLNLKEAIPIIKKYTKFYDKDITELCLARFGDTALQRKVIVSCSANNALDDHYWLDDFNEKFRRLIFINTQESISKVNQFIDTTHQFRLNGNGTLGWSVDRVIGYMREVIENADFRELTKNVNDLGYEKYPSEFIMQVKTWIIDNKGKYKINQEFCGY